VPTEAGEVDRYIDDAPEQRKPMLNALRSASRDELGGFRESLEHGMPSYSRQGEVEVAFASQKQYVSLYILRTDVMAAHRSELDHLSLGKGCIRYRKQEDVDYELVRSMLRETADSTGPVC
jgi:uncharacterized protein YdhG (YjbR/CyaY superfamily)